MNIEPVPTIPIPTPVQTTTLPLQLFATDPGKTLGIVGFILAFVGLTPVGLILSIIGYTKSKRAGFKNGLAVAGIWLNSIFIIMTGLIIGGLILAVSSGVITPTTQANTTQAQANATMVQKVAEAYNADMTRYPDTTTDLTVGGTSSVKLPTVISLLDRQTATLTGTNGLTTVWYQYSGPAGAATGGRVQYWDYRANKLAAVYVGDATVNSTFSELQ